ncbi:hypothetical protein SUDANB174_07541 [Streptomyces sp. enrichment culture]
MPPSGGGDHVHGVGLQVGPGGADDLLLDGVEHGGGGEPGAVGVAQPEASLVSREALRDRRGVGGRGVGAGGVARAEDVVEPLVGDVRVAEVGDGAVRVDGEDVVAQGAAALGVDAGGADRGEVGGVLGAVAGRAQDRGQRPAATGAVDDDPLGAAGHRGVVEAQVAHGCLGVDRGRGGLAGRRSVGADQPAAAVGDVDEDVAGLQGGADVAGRAVVGGVGGHARLEVTGHPAAVVHREVDGRAPVAEGTLGDEDVHALVAAGRVGDRAGAAAGPAGLLGRRRDRVRDVADLLVPAHVHRAAVHRDGDRRVGGGVEAQRGVLRVDRVAAAGGGRGRRAEGRHRRRREHQGTGERHACQEAAAGRGAPRAPACRVSEGVRSVGRSEPLHGSPLIEHRVLRPGPGTWV